MFIDRNFFEEWMRCILGRLDNLESRMKKPDSSGYVVDGEKLLDNQDLCFMLHCSKRTLQRYRVAGLLPCRRIRQKTYYLESDVANFIREYLKPVGKSKENTNFAEKFADDSI